MGSVLTTNQKLHVAKDIVAASVVITILRPHRRIFPMQLLSCDNEQPQRTDLRLSQVVNSNARWK